MIYVNDTPYAIGHYPDNTLLLKLPPRATDDVTIRWDYENSEELVALMFLTRTLQESGDKVSLFMPYIPNARMDRVKAWDDVFTLKYFCDIINGLGFTTVTVRDPHSAVSEALINNLRIYTSDLAYYISCASTACKPDYMFFPDEGAAKRYSSLVTRPHFFANKKRDWQTGKITGLELAMNGVELPLDRKTILIIDDICSKGGTFFHAAKALKAVGAGDIYLYVTHCENSIHDGELINSGLLKRIYTTPSILTKPHDLIEVLS